MDKKFILKRMSELEKYKKLTFGQLDFIHDNFDKDYRKRIEDKTEEYINEHKREIILDVIDLNFVFYEFLKECFTDDK